MKLLKNLFIFALFLGSVSVPAQKLALKSNLLYDVNATINLGVEMALGRKVTLDVSGNYNGWTYAENRKMKHWLLQPELRWWTCDRFSGHFWGLHALAGQFNFNGMLPFTFGNRQVLAAVAPNGLAKYRYEGFISGFGVSYGYQWILGKRWSLEASIGLGYAYMDYNKFGCEKCAEKKGHNRSHYFGPTKAALSIIYIIK
ncbi:DUF3575 domain-containing protein [Coprobacter tertius]|uniref:DUF3575 domain-containing protein n=1 Tax=Coprobacter tertius TaxID=2944915 RepID=A0ABT1MFH2_9BACT|nr:DUF3575 domain-containing protein [Coprobacter tertius]MCP9611377.1 DUF3575 domain-containing protein [Coprobacter tertius]